jgi:thiosulfate dehydrogenase [quinone] large subunit
MAAIATRQGQVIKEPGFIQALFNDPRASLIWLPVRIWLGWQWIEASMHKLSDPKWMVTGEALKGFWMGAVKIPEQGKPPITYEWYRGFLQALLDAQSYVWFAKLVSVGELLVGIGLIVGGVTAVAAFFGALMNFNFMLAGSASTNPVLFFIALLLILAWKVAGYIGVDFFILRWIGVPWGRKPSGSGKPSAG